MSTKSTAIWIGSVIAAATLGWFAATEVHRGPALESENDAYERFSNAFTITDAMDRIDTVSRLVRRLTPETLPGAVRALKDDLGDVFNNDMRMLMWYWAKQDPRGMLMEVQGWSEVRAQRMAAGEAVAWVLRKEGYDAARALFDQIPNHQRDPALPYLVLAYLESGETANLIELIESYEDRDERDIAARIVVAQILKVKGPEGLANWVESLPPGVGGKGALKPVAYRAAQDELMRRHQLEFLEGWIGRIDQEPWAAGARRAIGVDLAKHDPMKAIEWVRALPPEQGRDEILAETLRVFAIHDRQGALEWLRAEAPAAELDAGAARLAYEFVRRDPSIALEMVGRIQDAELFAKIKKMLTFEWENAAEGDREKLLAKLDAVRGPVLADEAVKVQSRDARAR